MPRPVVCKRNSIQEIEVQKWIEDILNEPFPIQYEEALKDGVILCRVMNTLSPGAIKKINMSGASFKLMENITRFHEALINYGVDKEDIFQTNDLFEKKDPAAVTNTIYALGRAVLKHPEWQGPQLISQQ